MVAAYRSQLKTRNQLSRESLKEVAAAVEQLTHRALVGLSAHFTQEEIAHAFLDGVRSIEMKQHLHMLLNEALNQALMLQAATAAAGPPARL
jgi:hypothetical protein